MLAKGVEESVSDNWFGTMLETQARLWHFLYVRRIWL